MKKLLIFFAVFCLMKSLYCQKSLSYTYILLEYDGPQDKVLPQVIFYIDSFDLKRKFYASVFKIGKCEFASIENKIFESGAFIQANIPDYQY
jgi:hypothetical protein